MNVKKIFLSPATILVIVVMIVGFSLTIYGQTSVGISMMIFIPSVAIFICSLLLSLSSNWKQAITMLIGLSALFLNAYVVLELRSSKNFAFFWLSNSLIILGISGLIYICRNKDGNK